MVKKFANESYKKKEKCVEEKTVYIYMCVGIDNETGDYSLNR